MRKHRGEVVADTLRKSGYSLQYLANKLGMNRNTFYNSFQNPHVSYSFIIELGTLIHHDFSVDFPEIAPTRPALEDHPIRFMEQSTADVVKLEKKYTDLLERYTHLLRILVKLATPTAAGKPKKKNEKAVKAQIAAFLS